jgi:FkbM family methyltransferase
MVRTDPKNMDIMLKSLTFFNLIKKLIGLPLTSWCFENCIAKCNFNGQVYRFYLARGHDSNIFLNPYFHEYDVTQFVFSHLSPGDVFLDVGSHAGLYALLSSKKVGLNGKVVCFEPNPINLILFKLNIKLNKLENIIVIPKAVADRPSKITLFYSEHKTGLTSAFGKGGKRIEVEAVTIDDVVTDLTLNSIKIIKVDTEGMDLKVLRGALGTLKKTQYVITEQNTHNIRRLLKDNGFKLSTLSPSGYLLGTNQKLEI